MTDKKVSIGIFLFDGAEELDFVGPFEVFTMINEVRAEQGEGPLVDVHLFSPLGADITGAKGMRVAVDHSFDTVPKLDVLCVPGGRGTRAVMKRQVQIDWIKNCAKTCDWVTSVCTGALVLAKAGLTDGRKITTHWSAFEEFKQLNLKGNLQTGVRYVQDGNLVTAAGVSAGIDMALWLTGQLFSPELARATQREMEYDPLPPYGETK